ncbi:DUF6588 family protein [Saccharicrinis aurantiacus]|uniref:DUF6588 family protein n=1 Tax=Saccharicrinis aurantiacus TaxID=1849719 RepID=UPI000839954B|nr:DUF6588 family protein [Saccharicrinis aurantiacus]
MKKAKLVLALILLTSTTYAQFGNKSIGDFLSLGTEDANTLANPYLAPMANMLGAGLNAGWYTSAKTHKTFGFDITVTGAYMPTSNKSKTFNVADYESQLNEFKLADPSNSISPTVMGQMDNRPKLVSQSDPFGTEISMPDGADLDYMVTPMITLGLGLPYGFELKGRFTTELDLDDYGKFSLWGLGVQKEIKEYIPGVKHVPFLNMSVLAAYTTLNAVTGVEFEESDGDLDVQSNAYTARLLVGANFPVVCFYTGLGYGNSNSDFNVIGDFVVNGETVTDPITQNFTTSTFDFNAGMRIRLGIFALHAEYTTGEYSAITGGVGISFR